VADDPRQSENDGAPRDDGLDVRWGSDWLYIASLYPDTEPYLWGLACALWDQGAREHPEGKPNPFWCEDPGV
jgi:hypothetical protein